jgi:hypothetical protein
MQLPLSADVLVPVGVGVLVAVVAVIVLVVGLRRRADDALVPTDDDWTGEHMGDVVAPPTRTVADAVAARQGNSNPFLVVSPAQPRAEEPGELPPYPVDVAQTERNGARRAVPLGVFASGVSASVAGKEHARHAAQGGARPAVVVADPAPAEVVTVAPVAAADATPNGTTELAAEARPVGLGEDGGSPADPLFRAGRFDKVGPAGLSWARVTTPESIWRPTWR